MRLSGFLMESLSSQAGGPGVKASPPPAANVDRVTLVDVYVNIDKKRGPSGRRNRS